VGRIILGSELAHRLHSRVGECLQILVPFSGVSTRPPAPTPSAWSASRSLGFHEYDARLAFINLEDARRMGNARQSIFGWNCALPTRCRLCAIEPEVERRLGPEARVIDWKTLNRNLFAALSMQKLVIAVLLFFIIVVAAFNIIASLMLIVLSKVRENRDSRFHGGARRHLAAVFLAAGTFVGFAGTGLGSCMAWPSAAGRALGYPWIPRCT